MVHSIRNNVFYFLSTVLCSLIITDVQYSTYTFSYAHRLDVDHLGVCTLPNYTKMIVYSTTLELPSDPLMSVLFKK